MDEWISPIDRHRHYGDAGRAECAVCCLEAERDHWRVLARREAADRDRLRAVVEIANRVVDRRDPEQWSVDHNAFAELGVALDQLDAGPTGEDT